ncbi:MAG: glycosyltransferase family 39 protein, partial [Candidatus Woesearchaeota archaeon]|nr:glycosyltransferase family 39 protein [Candidatus Woesearchaeota archaeon]
MFCPKCGKGINEVGRFCKWCGVEVSEFLERIRGVNDEEIKKEEPKHKVGGEERELERRRVLLMSRFKQGFNYVKERDWLICLLLFLGSFLIMYLLRADCLFHMDSVGYAMKAKLMFETLTQQYAHFTGYPGYIFIISVIYGFQKIVFNIQTAESATIFASVLFGALSVPLLYLFAKNILNKFIGIAASVFLAITPIFLSISTYGKDHTASVFFVLLSFYLLALYNKKGSNLLLALSSLCFGFSVTVRFTNLIIGLPYFLFY